MKRINWKRGMAAGIAAGLALLLGACLLTPGKFASTLDIRKDGRFAFTYTGEIHLMALSKLAQMGNATKTFTAEPCYNDDMKDRTCTAAELAEQKKTFTESQRATAEKSKKDAEGMKALLGGIDPSDPKAAEELAARLRRQVGWKSVIYKGDGLFVVDFALAGRIDHDFAFPTIERFPMANAFVQLARRNDGTVRMDAPGFSAASGGGNPFAALMSGMGEMGGGKEGTPAIPQFEGTFVLTTDGAVLANNTDEGPQPGTAGQTLTWLVNARNAAPTALVRLGQ